MKLEDLVPQSAKLKLGGVEYSLKPVTLLDEIWMNRRFGKDLQKLLSEGDMHTAAAIAFHQLEDEHKLEFMKKTVRVVNEAGEVEEISLGGETLFFTKIKGMVEKLALFETLAEVLGVGKAVSESKASAEKKRQELLNQPIGEQSLTPSVPNTDGTQSIVLGAQGTKYSGGSWPFAEETTKGQE